MQENKILRVVLGLAFASTVSVPEMYGWGGEARAGDEMPRIPVPGDRPDPDISGGPSQASVAGVVLPSDPGSYYPAQFQRQEIGDNNSGVVASCMFKDTSPKTKKPVVIATGEKFKEETDFLAASSVGLSVQRTYRSINSYGSFFGPSWMLGIERPPLQFGTIVSTYNGPYPQSVLIRDGEGGGVTVVKAIELPGAIQYEGPESVGHLMYVRGQYYEIYKDLRRYRYGLDGKILKVLSQNGSELVTYNYDTAGRVTSITNSAGQSLQFTWLSNGRVGNIIDPNLATWTYEYDLNGMLKKVTAPVATGSPTNTREYVYEDATNKTLLTGILVNGVRYSTYSYYADKRVKESGLAGREEVDTFVYGTGYTQVSDAHGQTTQYNFAQYGADKKLTSTSRSGTTTCPAAAASITYLANGDIDYALDFEGNKTTYSTDPTGKKALSVTTAAGTTNAITTVNTWSSSRLDSTEYRNASGTAFKRVSYTYKSDSTKLDFGLVDTITTTDLTTNEERKVGYEYTYWPDGVLGQRKVTQYLSSGDLVQTTNYDAEGNLLSEVNGLGQTVSYESHDGLGRPGAYIDLNGIKHVYAYYSNGPLKTDTGSCRPATERRLTPTTATAS